MATLILPDHVEEAHARLVLALGLFQDGTLSVGGAAEIAGMPYRAFADALVERGIPPYPPDDDPDTLAAEKESVRRLIGRVEAG